MAKLQTEMPKLKLNDGTSIPMIGYGTGTAMYKSEPDGKIDRISVECIKTAIKVGYYHLDCAENYNNEPEVGIAIKESKVPRDELWVTTKVEKNIADIPAALDASLKALQLNYVDLYLIHSPFGWSKSDADLQTAWCAMEAVKATGKARSIGVSNFLPTQLSAILATATVPPSMNQTEFHPYLQRGPLLPFMQSKDIAMAAYAPLTAVTKAKPGPLDATLAALAKKYFVTEGEICLRWCLDQGVVAITTSSKEQRLRDCMRALAFNLTPREVQDIKEKGAEKHFRAFFRTRFAEDDRS